MKSTCDIIHKGIIIEDEVCLEPSKEVHITYNILFHCFLLLSGYYWLYNNYYCLYDYVVKSFSPILCSSTTLPSQPINPGSIKLKLLKGQPRYTSCLERIRALLFQQPPPTVDKVEQLLGHGVLAGKEPHMHTGMKPVPFNYNNYCNM